MNAEESRADCNCNRHPVQSLCLRIRTTILFIGIILLIFGLSLILTFSSQRQAQENVQDVSVLNCDAFSSSMRLAGVLLIAVALFTISISLAFAIIYAKTKRILSCSGDVGSEGEVSERPSSGIRRFFSKLLQNWRGQSSVMTAEELHARLNHGTSSQEQPPEYQGLPGIQSLVIEPPPSYSAAVSAWPYLISCLRNYIYIVLMTPAKAIGMSL